MYAFVTTGCNVSVCMYVCMYVCMPLSPLDVMYPGSCHIRMHVLSCMYVYYMYVCASECMYCHVCMYICMYVYASECIYYHVCMYVCMYVYPNACTIMYVCMYVCMYVYLKAFTIIDEPLIGIHACIHTYRHTNLLIFLSAECSHVVDETLKGHTHMHTYMYTYKPTDLSLSRMPVMS